MKARLKRIAQTTAALTPLVLGAASPAHGCLIVPADHTAAERSEQIAGESDPLWGPRAPFDKLNTVAEERGQANEKGFACDDVGGCQAGNWQDTPAAGPTGGQ